MDIPELFEDLFKQDGKYDAEVFEHDGYQYTDLIINGTFQWFKLGYEKGLAQNINQREAYQRGHKAGYEEAIKKLKEQDNG